MGSCSSKKQIKQVEQPTPLGQAFLVQNQSQKLTIQNFTEYEQMYKLVSLDDLVFKMEEFKVSHPGGPHLIEAIIGKDVGRYLNGSSTEIINGQPAKMFTHPK